MFGRENLKTYTSSELYYKSADEFKVGEAYLKEEADKVMDNLEAQVKNLQTANAELIKRVQSLEDKCNELESQLPKWISTSDRLPKEGVFVYAVGKHLEGLLCFKENEWYTKEEVEDEPDSYWEVCGYDKDAIDYWMEKPLPPTTEENK